MSSSPSWVEVGAGSAAHTVKCIRNHVSVVLFCSSSYNHPPTNAMHRRSKSLLTINISHLAVIFRIFFWSPFALLIAVFSLDQRVFASASTSRRRLWWPCFSMRCTAERLGPRTRGPAVAFPAVRFFSLLSYVFIGYSTLFL